MMTTKSSGASGISGADDHPSESRTQRGHQQPTDIVSSRKNDDVVVEDEDDGTKRPVIEFSNDLAVQVLEDDDIMISIFTFLPITEQGKNKSVCKKWETLNTTSIEESPKKAFETTRELRKAVLHYCNQEGNYDYTPHEEPEVPPPTPAQQEMVAHVYGAVINNWNVSKLTDFSFIFLQCFDFNENISAWNTSNAKTMMGMFEEAASFNQPLNSWDTSNVECMTCMFDCAGRFNQPLNKWKTHNVKNMRFMFNRASSFNQPLNGWDTSTVEDMTFMFCEATVFNQPLHNWNTSNVQSMYNMFGDGFDEPTAFNQPIDTWDTSAITDPNRLPQR